MREQRAAMEKEVANMQAKAQGNFQELQNMQMKVFPALMGWIKLFWNIYHSF